MGVLLEEWVQSRTTFRRGRWFAFIVLLLTVGIGVYFVLMPKPLVVKGILKTSEGPVLAGRYDFRLKFYNASTRTDLVYSHDLKNVLVENGNFDITLPGDSLKVTTLMQVCITSSSKSLTDRSKPKIASCETSNQADNTAFDQTICGLTTVDHSPTNFVTWLSDQNVVFTTPSKGCGHKDGNVASVISKDVVTPLLEEPGTLGELLGGVRLQAGTVLAVGEGGQIESVAPANLIKGEIDKIKEQQLKEQTTRSTTIVRVSEGEQNTDSQTLSISGNVLGISGGNSVTLPSANPEGDAVIGNEVTDAVANSGLIRVGSGTVLDPYKIALEPCANGEILKSGGSGSWDCAVDAGGASYTAGSGLQLIGAQFSVNSPTCAGTTKLQWNGTAFVCSVDTDTNTTYSAGTGLSLVGTTFNNTGVLGVSGAGAITSTGGQNPSIAFANGSTTGQFWQWDGDSWELATLAAESDAVIGNEVTNVTGVNSGLSRSGSGTAVSPYTLAVSVGNGIQLTSGNVAINSPTCAGTTKLQWNGTAFVCSADVDTDTDTTNFSITDGSTSQSVSATQAITFLGDSTTKTTVTLGGTRQLTLGLNTTGAITGQVLTFNGSALAWQTPATYAPTTCGVSGTYFCQGGNTFGATATLGTNDAQSLAFETNNTAKMTILSGGNVGIGISTPAHTLQLDKSANNHIHFTNGATTGQTAADGLIVGTYADGAAIIGQQENNSLVLSTSATPRIVVQGGGNVGIGNVGPAILLHVGSFSGSPSGTTVARFENAGGICNVTPNVAGGISCSSDERLKKNIEDFSGAIDIVGKIDIKKFNMLADANGMPKQIGVIAQQLETVLPGLVQTDNNGYKSVSYAALAPILLQAVKEQQVQLEQVKQGLWTGGVVTKDATFRAAATFEGAVKFSQNATFEGDLEVVGKIRLSGDQVNKAVVQAGQRRVMIRFKGSYQNIPYITATPQEFVGSYRITDVKKTGFVIELSAPQKKATRYDWHAFSR